MDVVLEVLYIGIASSFSIYTRATCSLTIHMKEIYLKSEENKVCLFNDE